MSNKNEVAVVDAANVGFVSAGANMAAVFAEEMDGLSPSFERIKVPAGGGLAYEVPGDDPDSPDSAKEFKAVILHQHPINSYYKEKYTGGSAPPDCGSFDGKYGIVAETGEVKDCSSCPLSKFGSAEDGKGKGCKQKRRLFLLREGEVLPLVLTVPTGSLADYSKYVMRLLNKRRKPNTVVTKFTLRKEQNSGGITYSVVVCSVDRDLTEQESVVIEALSAQMKAMANRVSAGDEE